MKRWNKIFKKNIVGKNVLGLFILTNLVYAFMLLVTIPKTMAFSKGMKLLDMMPTGYNHEYVNTLFIFLGEKGRHVYLTQQLPVDMFYPLLFGISYSLMMAYFLKKINKFETTLSYLCLLPILAGIADYLENIGIIVMLKTYPDLTETNVSITNIFSVIKSVSTSLFFIALIGVLITLGLQFIKKKSGSK